MSYTYFALIFHPHKRDILTCRSRKLPTVEYGDISTDVGSLCLKVQNLVCDALRLFLMRTECEVFECDSNDKEDELSGYITKLLIFEIVSEEVSEPPDGFIWVPKKNASSIVVEPCASPVLQFLRLYEKSGLSINETRLQPYSRPGWFREASSWIQNVAATHGLDVMDVKQVSSKEEGCVMRGVCTNGSAVYFKHVGPLVLQDEIGTLQILSKVMPEFFKGPIEVDMERKWMLMHDHGTSLPRNGCSVSTNRDLFLHVLTKWGTIQKQSIQFSEELVELGMEVQDGQSFQSRFEQMTSNAEWCAVLSEEIGTAGVDTSMDETKFKDMLITYSTSLWKLISNTKLPLTLVHGDLNPLNVIHESNGRIDFIDFSFTCISFPFMDAFNFAHACHATEDDLQAYLDMWVEYESPEVIRELYKISQSLRIITATLYFFDVYNTAERSKRVSTHADLRSSISMLVRVVASLVPYISNFK